MKKIIGKNTLLILILVLAFALRLYRIDNPIADWHAWRQSDTAAVAKIYQQEGIDLLTPRYYDISNIQSGQDNPQGYRFVEFPIYQAATVIIANTVGVFSLEVWLRLVTITVSVAGIFFLQRVVKNNIGEKESYIASAVYAFLPFSIYYGRVILPDPHMISVSLASLYFFDKWLKDKSVVWLTSAIIATATAILIKPFAIFFAPVFLALAYGEMGISMFKKISIYLFGIISILPFLAWRYYISSFPEGVPSSAWLLDGGIRFRGAFFYWIFGERISKLILGYFGIFFVLLAFLKKEKDKGLLLTYSFALSALLYLTIFAGGNVQHDYYQIFLLPTISILFARGATHILSLKGAVNKTISILLIIVVSSLTFFLSWYYIRDYFNINNPTLVTAGRHADEILPQEAKVIAPLGGDTTLLYYVARPGWPAFQQPTEDLIQKGATHMVLLNPDEETTQDLTQKFTILESADNYIIVQLSQ